VIHVEGHRVLVELDPAEEVTEAGIIKVHETTERERLQSTEGTFMKMGPSADLYFKDGSKERKLKKGDRVLFVRGGGTEVQDGEDSFLIMNDEDILGILE